MPPTPYLDPARVTDRHDMLAEVLRAQARQGDTASIARLAELDAPPAPGPHGGPLWDREQGREHMADKVRAHAQHERRQDELTEQRRQNRDAANAAEQLLPAKERAAREAARRGWTKE
ncbi:hypothetical protein MM440_12295 [Arsenicicoccus piscis]|uniref:Uncharacterized protein n=2 Tax=Arsenicicoccus piscis TaxID=673954 RepID=A0ABQ6HNA5_9MICO|nr:hypothetical protein [Arsenicicoccus piscis]MCH8628525.1 hypothetical protein [Arsenicicoccus piscis]GMA19896.1 hypothetical protein GCM10025862_19170 [Arsenicicoccus piscis]